MPFSFLLIGWSLYILIEKSLRSFKLMKIKILRITLFRLKYADQCIKFIHSGQGWPKFVYWDIKLNAQQQMPPQIGTKMAICVHINQTTSFVAHKWLLKPETSVGFSQEYYNEHC